jgi:predicted nucleic acid-binding protein
MNKSLLDTDIFSEIAKCKNERVSQKLDCYLSFHERLTISNITVMETVVGLRKISRHDKISEFLNDLRKMEVLYLNQGSTILSAYIQADLEINGTPIELSDCLIASIAITNDLTLATGNTKHYQRIVDLGYPLVLENWKE